MPLLIRTYLQEGEIWPNSQAEISILFNPKEATSYSRVAYCDVIGRESRLPLRMRGEGVGPRCQFSFDTLDIQNVFVNSAHAYEVVLENKGDIESAYSLVPSQTFFGPKFTFAPSSGVLRPGGLQAIQVCCTSHACASVRFTVFLVGFRYHFVLLNWESLMRSFCGMWMGHPYHLNL